MSDTPQRVEVSALFLEDAKAFLARCKDEGLTTAIVAVEVPSPELAAAQSDLARLAQSNADLATEVERLRKLERMAATGTAQNWLKLPDEEKALWFALCVEESSRRKKAEEEVERLMEAVRIAEASKVLPTAAEGYRLTLHPSRVLAHCNGYSSGTHILTIKRRALSNEGE